MLESETNVTVTTIYVYPTNLEFLSFSSFEKQEQNGFIL